MKILLTGATGFIGTNLIELIKQSGDENEWYLLTSRQIDRFPCVLHKGYSFNTEDLRDVGVDAPDIVILLGGYIEKPGDDEIYNVRNHLASVKNVEHLLNCLTRPPKKIIFCSTIAVYGFDHASPWNPNVNCTLYTEKSEVGKSLSRTYSIVKILQERLTKEWAKENGCTCQILRIGSVYGPKREFYNFLGTCLRSAVSGRKLTMYAPTNQLWNFVYSKDVAQWIRNACNDWSEERTINLVSDINYTTIQILDEIKKVWPNFEYLIDEKHDLFGQHKAFDSTLRKEILGKEQYNLLSGLKEIKENIK